MKDYYQILGISQNASEEDLKKAYRELAGKYHPNNFSDEISASMAKEKIDEINEAYDFVIKNIKQRNGSQNSAGQYDDILRMIDEKRFEEAQEILDGVPADLRDAEWYYLNGIVLHKRGWFKNAYTSLATACRMDPNNMKYRNAFSKIEKNRRGVNYRTNDNYMNECSCCDMCMAAMCMDAICDCMRCC